LLTAAAVVVAIVSLGLPGRGATPTTQVT
jgi:hypothetical protein